MLHKGTLLSQTLRRSLSFYFDKRLLPATASKLDKVLPGCRHSSHFTYVPDTVSPSEGETVRMNMFQAVNSAMDIAMGTDPTAGKTLLPYQW